MSTLQEALVIIAKDIAHLPENWEIHRTDDTVNINHRAMGYMLHHIDDSTTFLLGTPLASQGHCDTVWLKGESDDFNLVTDSLHFLEQYYRDKRADKIIGDLASQERS